MASMTLLIFVVGFSATAFCEEKTKVKSYVTVGTSWISGSNVAPARDGAIANGLASAVEQATMELVPIETLVANFQPLSQSLFGRANKYVRGFKVLTEARSGKHYRVLVQVRVALDAISADLSSAGIISDGRAMPKVLLLLVEKQGQNEWPRFWRGEDQAFLTPFSEAAIKEAMVQKDLQVAARADNMEFLQTVVLTASPDFSPTQVVELGRRLQVDVVVVGHGAAESSNSGEGNRGSFRGVVRLQAFGSDTGKLLASGASETMVISDNDEDGIRQALAAAGAGAGNDIAGKIVMAWRKNEQEPSAITLVVTGTRNLGPFVLFRRTVGDLPRVKGMQIVEMKADEATIVIDFKGDAQALADAILLKTFESFKVNITEVTAADIKVALVAK